MRALNLELKIELFEMPTSPVSEDTLTYPNSMNAFTVYTINLLTLLILRSDHLLTGYDPLYDPIWPRFDQNLTQIKNHFQRSLAFIEENTLKVFDSERFNDLSDSALAALLRSDLLQLDEIEILDRVKKWAKTNSISSGQSIRKVSFFPGHLSSDVLVIGPMTY